MTNEVHLKKAIEIAYHGAWGLDPNTACYLMQDILDALEEAYEEGKTNERTK